MKTFLISIFILLIMIVPVFSSAFVFDSEKGLVPCRDGEECDFNAFMTLINNIIGFALVYLAVPIAAIMFAYAGFLMVTAGDEVASARTKAKGIFMNALIGLVLAAAGFLIVQALLSILGYNGSWLGFGNVL